MISRYRRSFDCGKPPPSFIFTKLLPAVHGDGFGSPPFWLGFDRSWKKRNKNSGLMRFFWISLPKKRGIFRFPLLLYDFSYIFREVIKIFSFLNGAENQIFVKWTKIVQRNEKIHESTKNRIGHQREEIWRKSSFLQRKIRSLYEKSCLRVYIIYTR